MRILKITSAFLFSILLGQISTAEINSSEALTYDGHRAVQLQTNDVAGEISAQSYEQIRRILDIEAGVRKVDEAIDLKRRGLQYVANIAEFQYLTSCPFPNPSMEYIEAVGNFIVSYVRPYITSAYDIPYINALESRLPLVNQAMALKQEGLRVATDINAFVALIPPSISNPSQAYRDAISAFIGTNIKLVLNNFSPIYMIVRAETFTSYVNHAMAVKRAGLVAVRTQRELMELATFSNPNPSPAYRQAVSDFLRENINRYP